MTEYFDDYPTCTETYATVRIWSERLSSAEISGLIGTEPTWSAAKGDVRSKHASPKHRHYEENGWHFCTRGLTDSRDCRRHLDILIEKVLGDGEVIRSLLEDGCRIDACVFYSYTQGGPTISPRQMEAFARSGIDLWWDLYRDSDEEGDSSDA